ncbi:hypothetical protein Csa_008538 [Cucumis sativus]|uniref:Uncharacterized protein n=1 Tax=Cucumis sativus TaxID=3659 RepID=A0A0A0KRE7_CUCSA|nr:hypothetical protein Csa_008538 [Cucumis sativus]
MAIGWENGGQLVEVEMTKLYRIMQSEVVTIDIWIVLLEVTFRYFHLYPHPHLHLHHHRHLRRHVPLHLHLMKGAVEEGKRVQKVWEF